MKNMSRAELEAELKEVDKLIAMRVRNPREHLCIPDYMNDYLKKRQKRLIEKLVDKQDEAAHKLYEAD